MSRVGDELSKVRRAGEQGSLQASARTLSFTPSEMGRRHGGSEQSTDLPSSGCCAENSP